MDNQNGAYEKVGGVTLDLTFYSGEDVYSDGDIEDEILDIVKNNAPEDYAAVIEERKSWPVFYHLSRFRSNIIDWLELKPTDRILEIGSGCGAITGALASKAGQVTCIDLSKKRSLINAYRNRGYSNITIKVGNFKDVEPTLEEDYDYVLLIGVFEYGKAYIGGRTPYEDFLRICNRHRSADGRLIIAIENKFGLKYWAGCREDHVGTYFSGLKGYPEGGSARTFTRNGLEKLMKSVGIDRYSFYYPYPDYKFMTTIYSDSFLPRKGELSNNLRNFDRDRVILFDEKQVFDQIIEDKEFPLFSNSYLLVIGAEPDVIYTKFSNDRKDELCIKTSVIRENPVTENVSGNNGKQRLCYILKVPCDDKSTEHLEKTYKAYEILSKRYEGTKIDVNKCTVIDSDGRYGLRFEYCKGVTLEALLDACLERADIDGFKLLIDEYLRWLRYGEEDAAVSNIDFIFPNILVERGKWHIIDYEWTIEEKVSYKKIAFRAFYNYTLGGETRLACRDMLLHDILGLSEDEIAEGIEAEKDFQHMISGEKASVCDMRELIGNRAYEFDGMVEYCLHADRKYAARLYFDYGEGFSEKDSAEIRGCYIENKNLVFTYRLPEGIKRLRIDPCSYRCAVSIRSIYAGDRPYTADVLETNGIWQPCGILVFDTDDPNIIINVPGAVVLKADMEVMELPELLAGQLNKKEEDRGMLRRVLDNCRKRIKF